eukprot:TRINITY_DN15556_c0_g1_i1.p1 TRINITY_DN15556_c0_g1~~TRINITY_DN15556_c0_g1_i1.p1  ORF type:complete len:135 (+),score=23.88 TRINITY_DN15556_c0_g1_i1:27-407(+)
MASELNVADMETFMKSRGFLAPNFTPTESQRLMAQTIAEEVGHTSTLHIIDALTRKCYGKCVPYPREALNYTESNCVNICVDRFVDAQAIVGQRMIRQQGNQQMEMSREFNRIQKTREVGEIQQKP